MLWTLWNKLSKFSYNFRRRQGVITLWSWKLADLRSWVDSRAKPSFRYCTKQFFERFLIKAKGSWRRNSSASECGGICREHLDELIRWRHTFFVALKGFLENCLFQTHRQRKGNWISTKVLFDWFKKKFTQVARNVEIRNSKVKVWRGKKSGGEDEDKVPVSSLPFCSFYYR